MECERAERMAGQGVLTDTTARKVLDEILERCGSDLMECPTIRDFFKDWMTGKTVAKTDGTSLRYENLVNEFLGHLKDRADKPLTTLTAKQIQGFINARIKAGLSGSTVHLNGKVLRTALNRARRLGLINVNPAEAVDLAEVRHGGARRLHPGRGQDADRRGHDGRLEDAHYAGLLHRRTLERLLPDGVGERRPEQADLDLHPGQDRRESGELPIHLDLEAHLHKLATDKPEKYIMPGMADRTPGARHGLSQTFKDIMKRAGVDAQPVEREEGVRTLCRRTFHALRHSFTSALANAGSNQNCG